MTTVYMNPVLAACIFKTAHKLGDGTWQAHNEQQAALVGQLAEIKRLIGAMPAGMLDSIGSTTAGPINEFLAAHNLDIRLDDFSPDEFGTAAVLDILSKWLVPGAVSSISVDHKSYKAVEMKGENIRVTTANDIEIVEPIIDELKGDCRVLIAQVDSLEAGLAAVRAKRIAVSDPIKGVKFPMVDFNSVANIGWLVGLTHSSGARLSKAVAQAKLRLDHLGAHAKAGAAIVVYRSMGGPRTIVIDKPFIVAFEMADQIAVAFHVTPEDWKQPPNLGEKGTAAGETW